MTSVALPGGNGALAQAQPGPVPASAPVLCWEAGEDVWTLPAQVVAVDDVVAAALNYNVVLGVDPADGSERWQYPVTDKEFGSVAGLSAGDGAIYAAGQEGLIAIEAADGSRRWRYRVDNDEGLTGYGGFFYPAAAGDAVYGTTQVELADGSGYTFSLVAIDAQSGDERWTVELAAMAPQAVTADGETVALVEGGESLRVVEAATGETSWSLPAFELPNRGRPATRLVLSPERIVLGLMTNDVVALSPADGSVLWTVTLDAGAPQGIVLVDDSLFVNGGTVLYRLDAATGEEQWRATIQSEQGYFDGREALPAVTDEAVLVGATDAMSNGTLVAFDRGAGTELWRTEPEQFGSYKGIVTTGGRVYMAREAFGCCSMLVSFGSP
jgi:outer membrane protein assembly factor BamB